MIELSVRSNLKQVTAHLNRAARTQVPYATRVALTEIARHVQNEERSAMERFLQDPTPFTVRSVGSKAATKLAPTAKVFMQDRAAWYLEPYEFGGVNKLNSKALLKPIDLAVNQYGNIPRGMLKRLKSRKDVFVGKVKTKSGRVIDGVWQRPLPPKGRRSKLANTTGRLKLLIEFSGAHPVHQKLHWLDTAKHVIAKTFRVEFDRAMTKALASAR